MPAECHVGPTEAIKWDWEKKADIVVMSNAEIIDRAIGAANANGWKGSAVYPEVYEAPEQLIFNHDFARALWGKEAPNHYCQVNGIDMWQYHLQQMVIANDPISYLNEHV